VPSIKKTSKVGLLPNLISNINKHTLWRTPFRILAVTGLNAHGCYDASNPFRRSFMILSLGLLADDASQACTFATLTV